MGEAKSEGRGDRERDWGEYGGQHSSCRPPGPVKPTPLFDPWMSRRGDEATLLGERLEFEWASYSFPSRYATTPYWTSSLLTWT